MQGLADPPLPKPPPATQGPGPASGTCVWISSLIDRFVSCFFFTASRSTRGRMVMPWGAGGCQAVQFCHPGGEVTEVPHPKVPETGMPLALTSPISQHPSCTYIKPTSS